MALELDFSTLRTAKSEIEEWSRSYEAAYKKLYTLTETLMHSYVTEDSKAFQNQLNSYQSQFQEMKALLDEYAIQLEIIAAGFEGVEAQLKSEASAIKF